MDSLVNTDGMTVKFSLTDVVVVRYRWTNGLIVGYKDKDTLSVTLAIPFLDHSFLKSEPTLQYFFFVNFLTFLVLLSCTWTDKGRLTNRQTDRRRTNRFTNRPTYLPMDKKVE